MSLFKKKFKIFWRIEKYFLSLTYEINEMEKIINKALSGPMCPLYYKRIDENIGACLFLEDNSLCFTISKFNQQKHEKHFGIDEFAYKVIIQIEGEKPTIMDINQLEVFALANDTEALHALFALTETYSQFKSKGRTLSEYTKYRDFAQYLTPLNLRTFTKSFHKVYNYGK